MVHSWMRHLQPHWLLTALTTRRQEDGERERNRTKRRQHEREQERVREERKTERRHEDRQGETGTLDGHLFVCASEQMCAVCSRGVSISLFKI